MFDGDCCGVLWVLDFVWGRYVLDYWCFYLYGGVRNLLWCSGIE